MSLPWFKGISYRQATVQATKPPSHCTDVLVMLPLTKRLVNSVIVIHRYLCNLNYIAKKILNNQRTDLLEI